MDPADAELLDVMKTLLLDGVSALTAIDFVEHWSTFPDMSHKPDTEFMYKMIREANLAGSSSANAAMTDFFNSAAGIAMKQKLTGPMIRRGKRKLTHRLREESLGIARLLLKAQMLDPVHTTSLKMIIQLSSTSLRKLAAQDMALTYVDGLRCRMEVKRCAYKEGIK